MDNLKTLFDNHQYSIIIDLFKKPSTGEEAFYLVNSYIQLSEYKHAMRDCVTYRKLIFEFNPIKCLELNFDLRFTLKQFDEAYEDLEKINEFPYVNQEVEENLRELKTIIRTNEKASYTEDHQYDDSSIVKELTSDDDYKVLMALDYITSRDAEKYFDFVVQLVESVNRHTYIKTYALMLLVAKQYNKQVIMKKGKDTFKVIPSKLDVPFTSKSFHRIHERAASLCKNTTIMAYFDNMIGNYQITKFPLLVENENTDLLIAAVLTICSENLSDPIDKSILLTETFTEEELKLKIEEIKAIDSEIPTI